MKWNTNSKEIPGDFYIIIITNDRQIYSGYASLWKHDAEQDEIFFNGEQYVGAIKLKQIIGWIFLDDLLSDFEN